MNTTRITTEIKPSKFSLETGKSTTGAKIERKTEQGKKQRESRFKKEKFGTLIQTNEEESVADETTNVHFTKTSKKNYKKKRPMMIPNKTRVWDSAKHFMENESGRLLEQKKQTDFYNQVKKANFLYPKSENPQVRQIKDPNHKKNVLDSADYFMRKNLFEKESQISDLTNNQFALLMERIDEDQLEHKKLRFLDFEFREKDLKHFDSGEYFMKMEEEKRKREKLGSLIEEQIKNFIDGKMMIDSADYFLKVEKAKKISGY